MITVREKIQRESNQALAALRFTLVAEHNQRAEAIEANTHKALADLKSNLLAENRKKVEAAENKLRIRQSHQC